MTFNLLTSFISYNYLRVIDDEEGNFIGRRFSIPVGDVELARLSSPRTNDPSEGRILSRRENAFKNIFEFAGSSVAQLACT